MKRDAIDPAAHENVSAGEQQRWRDAEGAGNRERALLAPKQRCGEGTAPPWHLIEAAQYRVYFAGIGAEAPALDCREHVALEHDVAPPASAHFLWCLVVSHALLNHVFAAQDHSVHIYIIFIDKSNKKRDNTCMTHPIWRLNEPSEDNLGLAFTDEGPVLGRTLLLERRGESFVVRDPRDIQRLLNRAYRTSFARDQIISGLTTVATAMNAGDQCLARIAAVQLRLPELSDRNARNELDEEDRLITSEALRRLGGVRKASPDDPKHPGWPAGTPDGRGGKFRPKGAASALTDKVKNIVARDQLRMNLAAALHVGIEALINLIPGLDVAADVMMVAEIARTMSEYRKLATDAVAALNFVQNGPYSLEDLQVSSDYKQFSSYDAFLKIRLNSTFTLKYFGPAGGGSQYHHLVTQGGANADTVLPRLQSMENIIILPTLLHEIVSDEYLKPALDGSNLTLYQWLQTQPYEVQREYGLKILRDLHILE